MLERADEAYEFKAYHLAIKYYQSYLKKKGHCNIAMAKLADCYWQTYQNQKAITQYKLYLQCPAAKPQVHQKYVNILMESGQYDLVKEYLKTTKVFSQEEKEKLLESCNWASSQQTTPVYKIYPLSVNSTSSDYDAFFYGADIIFNSGRKGIATPNVAFFNSTHQLFRCNENGERINESWNANLSNISAIHYSTDGKSAVYHKNDFVEGSRALFNNLKPLKVFFSKVDSTGQLIEQTELPFNNDEYNVGFPSFSVGGDTLFFASDMPGGFGGYDLYYSVKDEGGNWLSPNNVGPEINTAGNEIDPLFQNHVLYFASDNYLGFGGMDIYEAKVNEAGSLEIANLGKGINSSGDDYGFDYHRALNKVLLTSNRSGTKTKEDIYFFEPVLSASFSNSKTISASPFTLKTSFRIVTNQRLEFDTQLNFLPQLDLKAISYQLETPTLKLNVLQRTTQSVVATISRSIDPEPAPAPQFDGQSPIQIRVKTIPVGSAFHESEINYIGKVSIKNWKGYNIIYLSGYHSQEEAEQALKKLKSMNYSSATMVKKLPNGRLKSI